MRKDFDFLISTLRSSIKTWDYFVNWRKVFTNCAEIEIALNKLNYLLGKDDLKNEFYQLYQKNHDISKALPILLAIREKKLEIYDKKMRTSEYYDFTQMENHPEKYYEFLEKSGLTQLFQRNGIKNLVDYVMGVEVGLDSNGRKNRGGSLMEEITEIFIKDFCQQHNFKYLPQARASTILAKWNFKIKIDKSERSFDFAVYNPHNNKLKIFETNFYNGGGSKLKAVCGELRNLNDKLKSQHIDFIWITDGLGWHTAKRPLEDVFNHNDYIFNLHMLANGALDNLSW